jgi:geranylgeranyl diphosphate synthase, type II
MITDTARFSERIQHTIGQLTFGNEPLELYEPIRYLMKLGGKRMRPLLTLLGYSLYKEDWEKALKPALGVEVFHNFTLMHDDIMDQAPLRRGVPTVHEKWNANVAILSGDVMMVKAYELMMDVEDAHLRKVLSLFNTCAAEVCEGQQWDMNFEHSDTVTENDYLEMIRLKTAVLLGFSLELGSLLAGADEQSQLLLREFGTSVGVGFQLKDDLLDVYGDKAKFGKQVGGDIIANKKTYLLLQALRLAEGETATELNKWLSAKTFDKEEKVVAVTGIYDTLQIRALTEQKMNEYFSKGFTALEQLNARQEMKEVLRQFAVDLINRES